MAFLSSPVVLIGLGEMGGVFARGLLRDGHTIVPVTRATSLDEVAAEVPEPVMALITVGESDLPPVLEALPESWRSRVGLVQNELLPHDWEAQDIGSPTVASVWFEKKPGQDVKVIIPTPVWGPGTGLLTGALRSLGVPAREVTSLAAMRDELVVKNLYILTANIGGLAVGGGSVADLWNDHRLTAEAVAREAVAIQEFLIGEPLDAEPLITAMVDAFMADPDHGSMGRSAPARLERALAHADAGGLAVPTLRELASRRTEAE